MHKNDKTLPPWQPERFAQRRRNLEARACIMRAVRDYFHRLEFVEVETPALQVSGGLEPHLQAFKTRFIGPDGREHPMQLHTSPEFAMKKLLVAGMERIFQIARVFRNGEAASLHEPEFAMLEWYRADSGYRQIMDDSEGLLRAVAEALGIGAFWHGDKTADARAAFERLSVAQAFERYAGIDILELVGPDPLYPDATLLAPAVRALGLHVAADNSWDDLFFRVFLDRIEPQLGVGQPTILTDYPVSMAALSRPRADDPRLAERFEIYVCGLELANAFGELTDAHEQKRRFEADMALKEHLYGERYPIDPDFIAALEHGMPEAGGIALGLDRLAMLCTGARHIRDVLWLPVDLGSVALGRETL